MCVCWEVGGLSRIVDSQARVDCIRRVRSPLSTKTVSGEGDRLFFLSNLSRLEVRQRKSSAVVLPWQQAPGMGLGALGTDKLLDAFLTQPWLV